MKSLLRLAMPFGLAGAIAAPLTSAEAQQPAWQPGPGHVTLPLWPQGPPGHPASPGPEKDVADKKDLIGGTPVIRLTNVSDPSITVYAPPPGKANGAAVLVAPGGSYMVLAIDKEGSEICQWLNSLGITGILLKYRVPDAGPLPKSKIAFEDGQRAMGLIREHAAEWHIDPHRIGALGFSAGAHLSAVLSNLCATRIYPHVDAADDLPCRPDFQVIIYPGWLQSAEHPLTESEYIPIDPKGPPALIIQAEDDPVHVENSVTYFLALKKAGIDAEMHLYAHGGHGYGMRPTGKAITANWPKVAAVWFDTIGITKLATP